MATADRPSDVAVLQAEIRAQANASGATRATIVVTTDLSTLARTPSPSDPVTLLIVLGGTATRDDAEVKVAISGCRASLRACLPVWDPTARGDFTRQTPSEAHELNGFAWAHGDSPTEVAMVVLRLLGVTEAERRIFLSYARADGSAMAHALRHHLIDRGWDVFLDTFSVPPAARFQHRLYRDLADKTFLLLLETPEAAGRAWVEEEVAFAHRMRLGVTSLALPRTRPDQLFPSILPQVRKVLAASDVTGLAGSEAVADTAMERILHLVEQRHAEALQLRRETLMLDTASEMRRHGYKVSGIRPWALLGRRPDGDELALVVSRPPAPRDLLAAEDLRRMLRSSGKPLRAWVVHTLEDIDEDRARLLRWLSAHRKVRPSPLMLLAERMER